MQDKLNGNLAEQRVESSGALISRATIGNVGRPSVVRNA